MVLKIIRLLNIALIKGGRGVQAYHFIKKDFKELEGKAKCFEI